MCHYRNKKKLDICIQILSESTKWDTNYSVLWMAQEYASSIRTIITVINCFNFRQFKSSQIGYKAGIIDVYFTHESLIFDVEQINSFV